ncbi:MAG: hypothetical protein ABIE42_10185 [Candidatus Eisenbacteria bacterium]
MKGYDNKKHQRFSDECAAAGLDVENYRGRCFYEGPAVRTDDRQAVIRATTVPLQWDNMGKGWIVYPC